MDDMLKDFVVEALELAVNVEEHLLTLEKKPGDKEVLNAVFRSFHTIKGGAGFMNLPAMVAACHLTENLFDALRNGAAPVTPIAIEAALRASGFVADQLTALANGADPSSLAAMPDSLEIILTNAIEGREDIPVLKAKIEIKKTTVALASSPQKVNVVGADGIDWQAFYDAVVPGGQLEVSLLESEIIEDLDDDDVVVVVENNSSDSRSEGSIDSRIATPVKEDSIRVDAVKLDALLEVAGETVQAANQAGVLVERLMQFKFDGPAATLMATLSETRERAARYSTELQRATLATRMQPVGRLFQKFPRMVRELSKDLGKDVELLIEGAETEVDRVVVDSLYEPLVHMLRNALDHGVESPDDRVASGKPRKSFISLNAWQEANSVMIVLQDDGKGMDPTALRKKAIQKGLISDSVQLTDAEAFQLVFLPGFSTKELATSVSGRGVGMDVVKTAVEKNRGDIYIESSLGVGTKFSIRLPIELSIVPTMLVSTAGAVLALPMGMVQRVVELPDTYLHVSGEPVLKDQGLPLPVRSLAGSLGYTPGVERVGIVVAATQPYILAVESVESTADLVIKPLTAISVEGITGTARSAEGALVLVVGMTFLRDGCRIKAVA
jgi:two-component system chemotaxis sensor kinase CheA